MADILPIAFYLPQYYPIPENDEWWGKGFTEWTNVTKAKPLFQGHKQPRFPADLGYYDLRVPEVRELQAKLARNAGIEGFCYWHYWFGNGKRLLERPFKEVLESGNPDFPFCLAWANESWSGIWHGLPEKILLKQEYGGPKDYEAHFYEILPAFLDRRYIKIDGKPLFIVYNPSGLPNMKEFSDIFQDLAIKNKLGGIHLVANNINNVKIDWDPGATGFNAYTISAHSRIMHEEDPFMAAEYVQPEKKSIFKKAVNKVLWMLSDRTLSTPEKTPHYKFKYEDAMKYFFIENDLAIDSYPTIITGWDNSPRCGNDALILTDYTPEIFREHIRKVFPYIEKNKNKIVFIKSWNEWAEGNYLEPDSEFGTRFLDVLKEEINNYRFQL
jgi:hypothetical protein